MIPKRIKRPKMGVRQFEGDIPAHRKYVRGFACIVPGCDARRIEAAHCRAGITNDGRGGTALKPHDKWCFPACSDHHAEQHRIGERSFAAKHGVDPIAVAGRIWKQSPHRPREAA